MFVEFDNLKTESRYILTVKKDKMHFVGVKCVLREDRKIYFKVLRALDQHFLNLRTTLTHNSKQWAEGRILPKETS